MNHIYRLNDDFIIDTDKVRKLKCLSCEEVLSYHLYSKQSNVYCACTNLVLKSKGSHMKLMNAVVYEDKKTNG